MPRPPRLQYPDAIDHLVTRGVRRRTLLHDDGHYKRFTQGLSDEVSRSGWIVLAFCWMPNHVHAMIKTPEPNLYRGMQYWLSGNANWLPMINTIGTGRDSTEAPIRRQRIAGLCERRIDRFRRSENRSSS